MQGYPASQHGGHLLLAEDIIIDHCHLQNFNQSKVYTLSGFHEKLSFNVSGVLRPRECHILSILAYSGEIDALPGMERQELRRAPGLQVYCKYIYMSKCGADLVPAFNMANLWGITRLDKSDNLTRKHGT